MEIVLPPLRERKDDIPKLVRFFLDKYGKREGLHDVRITQDALQKIMRYPFPGNVRELENLIEGAASLARAGVIRLEDLQWLPALGRQVPEAAPEAEAADVPNLRALQERHIRRVLKLVGGNKSRAARLLGISPRCIFNKMRKYHRITA